jgi:hypothetical protein
MKDASLDEQGKSHLALAGDILGSYIISEQSPQIATVGHITLEEQMYRRALVLFSVGATSAACEQIEILESHKPDSVFLSELHNVVPQEECRESSELITGQ